MWNLQGRFTQMTGFYLKLIPRPVWKEEPNKLQRWPIWARNVRGGWNLRAHRLVLGYVLKSTWPNFWDV